jgi:hypothetical protein
LVWNGRRDGPISRRLTIPHPSSNPHLIYYLEPCCTLGEITAPRNLFSALQKLLAFAKLAEKSGVLDLYLEALILFRLACHPLDVLLSFRAISLYIRQAQEDIVNEWRIKLLGKRLLCDRLRFVKPVEGRVRASLVTVWDGHPRIQALSFLKL